MLEDFCFKSKIIVMSLNLYCVVTQIMKRGKTILDRFFNMHSKWQWDLNIIERYFVKTSKGILRKN